MKSREDVTKGGTLMKRIATVALTLAAVAGLSVLALRAQEMRNIRTYVVHVDSTDGKPVRVDGTFWVDGAIPHARVIHQMTPFAITEAGTIANGLFAAARGSIRVKLTIQDGGSAEAEGPMVAVVQGLTPTAGQGFMKTFETDVP